MNLGPCFIKENEMTFRVGQKIVCIDASQSMTTTHVAPLLQGAIYTVADIIRAKDDSVGLMLFEIPSKGPDWIGYDPDRFRPLVDQEPDISIFTEMLIGSKKRKELKIG